ncbi:dienelactone hydrolase family protein [Eubacteriaceae bacterium ES2]|nr:dienelactone hydrolase family protein [Eubacteriaceae bacterium ES2]
MHEIYGINSFIHSICRYYQNKGFDVFYPNLLKREVFSYQEEKKRTVILILT